MLWHHMYEAWSELGLVTFVNVAKNWNGILNNSFGQEMPSISFSDVVSATAKNASFFAQYQMELVGSLCGQCWKKPDILHGLLHQVFIFGSLFLVLLE